MMDRAATLAAMGQLKLHGMRAAYDELLTQALKRRQEPQALVGDLLSAELAEKAARSIKYQMTIARLPLMKDMSDYVFDDTPVNRVLIEDLARGTFLDQQRNVAHSDESGHRFRRKAATCSDPKRPLWPWVEDGVVIVAVG